MQKDKINNIVDAYNSMYKESIGAAVGGAMGAMSAIRSMKSRLSSRSDRKLGAQNDEVDNKINRKDDRHMHPKDRHDEMKNQNGHEEIGMHHKFAADEHHDEGNHEEAKKHDAAAHAHIEAGLHASENNDKIDEKLSASAHKLSAKAYGGKKFKHLEQTSRTGKAKNHPLVRDVLHAHGHDQPNILSSHHADDNK